MRSCLMRTVSTIGSRNSGAMWNNVQAGGNREASPQRMYRVRIENSSRHPDRMECPRRNPDRKVGTDQPDARTCIDLHHSADCIDKLIRARSVLVHVETARIFIRSVEIRTPRPGSYSVMKPCRSTRYIIAQDQSCDKRFSG